MDEDQNSVEEQVTPQDQDSTIVDEQPQEDVQGDSPGQDEDPQDKNWRELRKGKETAELQARNAEEKIKMQEEFIKNLMAQNLQPATKPEPVEEPEQISHEEYPNYGQMQKSARAIAREEFTRLEKERDVKNFKSKLERRYDDFGDVVNSETIAILEKQEPELAATIADLKDPYKMGIQSYKFIKAMNLAPSRDTKRRAKEVVDNIEKNEKTIQSPQVHNKRPMAQAFSMTNLSQSEKDKLYEETLGYASQSPGY